MAATTRVLAPSARARAASSRRRANETRARTGASASASSSSSNIAFRSKTKTKMFAGSDDDIGAPAATSARDALVRALLVLDDRSHDQLGVTVEGRLLRDDVPACDVAARLRALCSALPRSCSRHVFELVVERPGLLTLDADACGRAVTRCADALGGADALEKLCEECAPAFAHVLWRLGCLETTFDEMERPLKEWVRGEEGWHRVFVQRIASEWGYLRMMKRMNTSTYAGQGVVYRNAKTGESIAFQQSQSIVDRHRASGS